MAELKIDAEGRSAPGAESTWDGTHLKQAMSAASTWLERHAAGLNALNVFPVPDGDTGTNMTLTMQAACKQVAGLTSPSVAEISQGLSYGALMGARGNSGVIFSQVLRGFHRGLQGSAQLGAVEWAAGLREAATTAYQAVLKPVEGTMLTVIREMAEGAEGAAAQGNSLLEVMTATVEAGRASVARTPTLLQKLRDAGVVDAGGQGLFVIFEGLLRFARGESVTEGGMAASNGAPPELAPEGVHVAHGEYGYCTNFILIGKDLDFPTVREWIAGKGDSAVIVGDDRAIKVHIHTTDPGQILSYVCPLGSVRQVTITDMQEQHEDFLDMHEQAAAHAAAPPAPAPPDTSLGTIATIAVVSGQGLAQAFRSMGATALVEGGQTMNPSTEELLRAIEALPHEEVILLPNNGNIVLAAKQTQALSKKRIAVVPTDTLPQGMAALVAFNYEADLETNARAMEEAAAQVETGEITTAVRQVNMDGVVVNIGDVIGLHNGTLVLAGHSNEEVARQLLTKMEAGTRELITVYYGQDVSAEQAAAFATTIREQYPDQAVEVLSGGQPFYAYIISVE